MRQRILPQENERIVFEASSGTQIPGSQGNGDEASKHKKNWSDFFIAGIITIVFVAFSLLAKNFDVKPIGPNGSRVGFATLNQLVFGRFGVNLFWYELTDWLGLVAIIVAGGFALTGLCQLIARRNITRVDADLLLLGVFYVAVIGCYLFFEKAVVNYRPILLQGSLDASYPSTHTMIVTCIMITAMMQVDSRVHSRHIRRALKGAAVFVIGLTVIGRLLAGVHWCTDIVGGILLSAALCAFYLAGIRRLDTSRKGDDRRNG